MLRIARGICKQRGRLKSIRNNKDTDINVTHNEEDRSREFITHWTYYRKIDRATRLKNMFECIARQRQGKRAKIIKRNKNIGSSVAI